MATDDHGDRQQVILEAISREIERQAEDDDLAEINLVALAMAVDQALGGAEAAQAEPETYDDGKEPDELNAANDG